VQPAAEVATAIRASRFCFWEGKRAGEGGDEAGVANEGLTGKGRTLVVGKAPTQSAQPPQIHILPERALELNRGVDVVRKGYIA
jgi:hypothetical protein